VRINHNIAALNTYRQLSVNNTLQQKSLQKLSSGLRINSAADDAAGLAISEKMRGQIRGLEQATRNAQDGISLIQTAEGALNETHSILQRMRELAIQSSNDTNTSVDRAEIQKEVDELSKELSRIGNNTEFNTQNLLDGTFTGTFQIGANESQNIELQVSDMRGASLNVVGDAKMELTGTNTPGTTLDLTDGTYTIDGTDLKDSNGNVVATTSDNGVTWVGNGTDGDGSAWGNDSVAFSEAVDSGTIVVSGSGTTVTGTAVITNEGLEAGTYTYDATNSALLNSNGDTVATDSTTAGTFVDAEGNTLLTLTASPTDGQEITVGGVDVSTQTAADAAITTIQSAIETVSAERSKLGAYANRLEHTVNNLGTSAENLTAAESRIRDVDMAKEMMEFTKMNILSQAAQAMLAQANQLPQGVLQLLR